MLLLLFGRSQDATPAVGSTGYGVICIEAPVLIDELSASVLMGEIVSNANIDEVDLTVHETKLSSTLSTSVLVGVNSDEVNLTVHETTLSSTWAC